MSADRHSHIIYAHSNAVTSVHFSPCGKYLISGSIGSIRIWSLEKMSLLEEFKDAPDTVRCVRFSPDKEGWAVLGKDVGLMYFSKGEKKQNKTPLIHSNFEFTPDGKYIVFNDCNRISLWDYRAGTITKTSCAHLAGDGLCLAVSPNGQWVASSGHECYIRLHNLRTGKDVSFLEGHVSHVRGLAFSNDSLLLGSGDISAVLMYWNLSNPNIPTLESQFQWSGHEILDVAFSPTMTIFASTGSDNRIKLFDYKDKNKKLEDITGHQKIVRSISFSPDGKYIASGSNDCTIRIWGVKQPIFVS